MRGQSQVVTTAPDGTAPRYLGTLGPVTGLTWSFVMPGGCDQASATLQADARYRTDALNPGRLVRIVRGGSAVWTGTLLEPVPSSDGSGWAITAQGSGTYGANFAAHYTGTWDVNSDDTVNQAINNAITRGLRWVNPGVPGTSLLYTAVPVDSAAVQIDALLNGVCVNGGLTWYVQQAADGNILRVFPIPVAPTRLLVSASPVARSLGGDINRVWLRYEHDADAGVPAVFTDTFAENAASEAAYGPMETFTDVSSAGVMSASAAQAVGASVLARYQRASFAGPFTVQPGQLLTLGGQPVDLGTEQAGGVCKLILTDFAYGGEATPGAGVTFPVGGYSYDEDTETAAITPFQSLFTDFASLMSQLSASVTPHPNRT